MDLFIKNLNELNAAAQNIIAFAGDQKVFLFYGNMGAGKTTLISAICKQLGTADNTSSPTFAIVNEYIIRGGKIFHFDFYRLKSQNEALDIGFEEYLYSGHYCFIEWPENIPGLLPAHYIRIQMRIMDNNSRHIHADKI